MSQYALSKVHLSVGHPGPIPVLLFSGFGLHLQPPRDHFWTVLVLISGALVYEIVSATSLFNTWCLGPRESTSQRGDCRVDLRDMQIADPRIPLTHFSTF